MAKFVNKRFKVIALIPVRLNSKRLPKKALLPISNLPIVIHVYRRVLLAKKIDEAYICCDDKKILDSATKFGAKVILTSKKHKNGTERILEGYKKIKRKYNLILDVQGDEPLINPQHIDKVIEFHLKNKDADIVVPNLLVDNKFNKNIVKIVSNKKNKIIYFSRLQVPFDMDKKQKKLKKHLSIISFKPISLKKYNSEKPTENEQIEKIELMRAIELGMNVKTFTLKGDSFSVDVKKDYFKAKKRMKKDKFFNFYK